MKFGRRSKRTTIIFDEGDLTEFLAEGTISGRSKGQNFVITCPPTSMGISEGAYKTVADELKDANKALKISRDDIGRYDTRVIGLEKDQEEQRVQEKKLIKAIKKFQKQLKEQDEDTIPINEHQDLMNEKIESHDKVVEALEEAQATVVEKLDDECDDLRAAVTDLNKQVGNLENDLQLAKTDLQQCENDLADCEN